MIDYSCSFEEEDGFCHCPYCPAAGDPCPVFEYQNICKFYTIEVPEEMFTEEEKEEIV